MKIQVISDMHGIAGMPVEKVGDVLVCLGDVTHYWEHLPRALENVDIFVPGNHEYYGHFIDSGVPPYFNDLEVVEIDGLRFACATLWGEIEFVPKDIIYRLNDFNYIGGMTVDEMARLNKIAREFLMDADAEIACTHFGPDIRLVDPRYKGSVFNPYFFNTGLTFGEKYKLWLYGHTHIPNDTILDGCRFVCNPRGMVGERNGFNPYYVVDYV